MKIAVIVLLVCVFSSKLTAQDPHYSQFFASPLTLNPALAGKFDGITRVTFNHRDQWPSIPKAYVTSGAGVDFGIMKNKIPQGDVFGVGISGMRDATANSILNTNFGTLTMAYHKSLDEDGYNTIGVGFSGSYSSMNLDVTKLNFEDALTQNGFTTGTSLDIPSLNRRRDYFSVAAGLLYSGSTNGENNFYVGTSLYHINRPKVGFKDNNWNLSSRLSAHAGGTFPIGQALELSPFVLYQTQNKASELVAGSALTYNLNGDYEKPTKVYVGAWTRIGDAIIPFVGLEFANMRIGSSYDVNTSRLNTATASRGGSEFSLIYIVKKGDYKGIPCPRF